MTRDKSDCQFGEMRNSTLAREFRCQFSHLLAFPCTGDQQKWLIIAGTISRAAIDTRECQDFEGRLHITACISFSGDEFLVHQRIVRVNLREGQSSVLSCGDHVGHGAPGGDHRV